jgi:hypothetical protein
VSGSRIKVWSTVYGSALGVCGSYCTVVHAALCCAALRCAVLRCAVLQAMFTGGKDVIAVSEDIALQTKRLVNAPVTHFHYKDYAHMDFVSGQAGALGCYLRLLGKMHGICVGV